MALTEEKVNVVSELRLTYPLMILLQGSGLAKSVYYYTLSKIYKDNKNKGIIEQINDMLNKAFDKNKNFDGLIFHSDQGWQYQHNSYQQRLKNQGIKQSMSRKRNSMDNGMMENFFGILKTEIFYDQEDNYKTLDDLIKAIDDYIYYYNYDRIKVKLKGLSPVNYRLQSSI